MGWHYARLCALSILLELPLREAGYGTFFFGVLIVSISYAAAAAAGGSQAPGDLQPQGS
jgi:hypothetical protein